MAVSYERFLDVVDVDRLEGEVMLAKGSSPPKSVVDIFYLMTAINFAMLRVKQR
jgi:hypothetical protein